MRAEERGVWLQRANRHAKRTQASLAVRRDRSKAKRRAAEARVRGMRKRIKELQEALRQSTEQRVSTR